MLRTIKALIGISLLLMPLHITKAMPLDGQSQKPAATTAVTPDLNQIHQNFLTRTTELRALSQNAGTTIVKERISTSSQLKTQAASSSALKEKVSTLKAAMPNLQIHYNARNGSASFIKSKGLCTANQTSAELTAPKAKEIAIDCLAKYQELLKVNDAGEEFAIQSKSTDNLGLTHIKLQQQYMGLPVWGKEVLVHLDSSNSAYLIEGNVEPTPTVSTTATITEAKAIELVSADLGETLTKSTSELVIHTDSLGIMRLVYHITASAGLDRWQYFIDANQGIVVEKYYDTKHEAITGSGTDLNGATQSFSSWLYNSYYYMIDTSLAFHSTNPSLPGSNGLGNIIILNLNHQSYNNYNAAYYVKSTSATSGWDTTAVTAVTNFRTVANYYYDTFSRSSFDNASHNIVAYIHVGQNYDNAFWQSDLQAIFFGDGGTYFNSLVNGLDVMAHEYTHGITENTTNLEYKFQSGALDEAISDIFACMIDRDDWTIAEDVTQISPGYLRNLVNPHLGADGELPATMSEYQNMSINNDNGGVHVNCTIPTHAAYLIAEGLGTGSIGRDKTEQIFYRAVTQHLTRQSDFEDCRTATIQSAEELYGEDSAEATAVAAGWDAVEVTDSTTDNDGSGDSSNDGTVDPIDGDDQLVFVYYQNGKPYLGLMDSDGNEYRVSSQPVSLVRPVVVLDGEAVLYVDASHNLRIASLLTSSCYDESVLNDGTVRTVGGSHDGRYFVFTTTAYDNNIYLLDMDDSTGSGDETFALAWPNDANTTTSSLQYADVMDFDVTNTKIVFDAMSETTLSGESDTTYEFWNIGTLDISSGEIDSLVSAGPEGTNVGNPSMANLSDSLMAMDIVDTTTGTCKTMAVNLDTNESGLIIEETNSEAYGFPCFNGNDTSVAVQNQGNAINVPLVESSEGILTGDTANAQTLRTSSYYPRYFRIGEQEATPRFHISSTAIAFGPVTLGRSLNRTLLISNTGTVSLTLDNFVLSDTENFSHTGVTSTLDAGKSIRITVTFAPTTAGSKTATLTITTNDTDNSSVAVSLAGTATESDGTGENSGDTDTSGDTSDTDGGIVVTTSDGETYTISGCFIATAAYGSYMADDVKVLRQFRDSCLITNEPGRAFVRFYYRYSPPIANVIAKYSVLRLMTRIGLTPMVWSIKHPNDALAVVLLISTAIIGGRRNKQARRKRVLQAA
jgi:Zn-dependent metalloprotease